ncbi:MAG: HAMP domain-containing histidine kinase [Anaerolineae bacterium]|nr:MAG: HAMP domain-containing histidine kinase [Anaerolineae bacterium]
MFRSIRWRLVLSYVFLILLTLGVVGVVILQLVGDYVERREVEYLTANAEGVAHQARSLVWPVVRQSGLQDLAETSSFLGNAQVRIIDVNRRVLADSESGSGEVESTWILPPLELWREIAKGLPQSFVVQLPSGRRLPVPLLWGWESFDFERLPPDTSFTLVRRWDGMWGSGFRFDVIRDPEQLRDLAVRVDNSPRSDRVIMVPIGQAEEPLGYVQVSNGPDFVTEVLTTTRQAFVYAAAGAMLVAMAVGLAVGRGLSAPLRRLTAVAGQMSHGDLSIRAPVRGKDEIGQLAGQFNQMAERLEASFAELAAERDALRRFVGDASHELRTPITALKSFNDLLQGAAVDDPPAHAEFLAESQAQIDRLEWITRNLLDLSRFDAGLVVLDVAEHSAGQLIEAAACAFRPLAQEKGITLSIKPPPSSLRFRCDRARIEMALSNLLDNALKFTSVGGQVEIGAEQTPKAVRLWVRDSGPGIDPVDRSYIFERFYRGRNSHAEGSGLGLAIVQSVVRAHGGQVSVESEPGVGSLFVIELPRS